MSKFGYFLGGVLTGVVALSALAWFVAESDNDDLGPDPDAEDDGCLEDTGEAQ